MRPIVLVQGDLIVVVRVWLKIVAFRFMKPEIIEEWGSLVS